MALSKKINVKTNIGINVDVLAYIKIKKVEVVKSTAMVFIDFKKDQHDTDEPFKVAFLNFEYDMEKANPIRQAYEHMKTLDEYAGAEDC